MNLNPHWSNETFVLPVDGSFYEALHTVLYGSDPDMRTRVLNKYKRKVSQPASSRTTASQAGLRIDPT